MNDLHWMTVAEVARAIAARNLSPVELMEMLLERIARLDPKLNAFIRLDGDVAIHAARAAEAEIASGRQRGPLHGVPDSGSHATLRWREMDSNFQYANIVRWHRATDLPLRSTVKRRSAGRPPPMARPRSETQRGSKAYLMFGRMGFGFHNLFGREDLEVAHLPRPMEKWRVKQWQLTHQTHSISMLRWMDAL